MLLPRYASCGLVIATLLVAALPLFATWPAPPTSEHTVHRSAGLTRDSAGWAECTAKLRPRLAKYCNFPPALASDEGVAPVPGAVLRQVLINFLHGDRSAIHILPATERAGWECGKPSHSDVRWAASLLTPFHSTRECIARGTPGACSAHDASARAAPSRVQTAFRAWATIRANGEPCGPTGGELSTTGWSQLLEIGHSLGGRYRGLLRTGNPATTALRVVSTDTGRTVLSATAMTQGLLAGAAAWDAEGEASEGAAGDAAAAVAAATAAVSLQQSLEDGVAANDTAALKQALPPSSAWTEHAWAHRHVVPGERGWDD